MLSRDLLGIETTEAPARPRVGTLAAFDRMPFTAATHMPHCTTLSRWSAAGYYENDLVLSVFRLTAAGHLRARQSCGACASWLQRPGSDTGECWSGDRLDGDDSKGPADITYSENTCEAFRPAEPAST